MSGLKRYIEWMSRGRRTNREVYALKEWIFPIRYPEPNGSSTKPSIWLMSFCVIPS